MAFKVMKSSGFNIEYTHMRNIKRIARLVERVGIALQWTYLICDHKDMNCKPMKFLIHGRKPKSFIKYGIEEISTILLRQIYTPKFDVFKFSISPIYGMESKVRSK